MGERVVTVDLGVFWDPNAPGAVLATDDGRRSVLALNPHPADSDKRTVALVWAGSRHACLSGPNDEAIDGHRLYTRGLANVRWAGIVHDSQLVRVQERQNRVHLHQDASTLQGLSHYVVLTKECVVEVVATGIAVQRPAGAPALAAARALAG